MKGILKIVKSNTDIEISPARSSLWLSTITTWLAIQHQQLHNQKLNCRLEDCEDDMCTYVRYLIDEVIRLDKRIEQEIQHCQKFHTTK